MTRSGPLLVHVGLFGVVSIMFLIGGQATLGSWGTLPVRPVSLLLLAAIGVHAASSLLPWGSVLARGVAWGILVACTLLFEPLLRVPVVAPIVALSVIDLVLHRRGLGLEGFQAGARGQVIAGVSTVAMLVLFALLMVLSRDGFVLARLGGTVLVAWLVVAVLALAPGVRSPGAFLGAAGVVSVVFLFLAAPVLPYGPLLAYLVLVGSMAVAVLVGVSARVEGSFDEEHRVHEQTVNVLRDPSLSSLSARVGRFLASGRGEEALSARLEEALGREEGGRLLARAVRAQAREGEVDRSHREEALVRLLRGRGDAFQDGDA